MMQHRLGLLHDQAVPQYSVIKAGQGNNPIVQVPTSSSTELDNLIP
jgi:hypothetical protein